jgi:hypothetical protein
MLGNKLNTSTVTFIPNHSTPVPHMLRCIQACAAAGLPSMPASVQRPRCPVRRHNQGVEGSCRAGMGQPPAPRLDHCAGPHCEWWGLCFFDHVCQHVYSKPHAVIYQHSHLHSLAEELCLCLPWFRSWWATTAPLSSSPALWVVEPACQEPCHLHCLGRKPWRSHRWG